MVVETVEAAAVGLGFLFRDGTGGGVFWGWCDRIGVSVRVRISSMEVGWGCRGFQLGLGLELGFVWRRWQRWSEGWEKVNKGLKM